MCSERCLRCDSSYTHAGSIRQPCTSAAFACTSSSCCPITASKKRPVSHMLMWPGCDQSTAPPLAALASFQSYPAALSPLIPLQPTCCKVAPTSEASEPGQRHACRALLQPKPEQWQPSRPGGPPSARARPTSTTAPTMTRSPPTTSPTGVLQALLQVTPSRWRSTASKHAHAPASNDLCHLQK